MIVMEVFHEEMKTVPLAILISSEAQILPLPPITDNLKHAAPPNDVQLEAS